MGGGYAGVGKVSEGKRREVQTSLMRPKYLPRLWSTFRDKNEPMLQFASQRALINGWN